jgi:hypothetical protein
VAVTFHLSLDCPGANRSVTGPPSLSTSLTSPAGTCYVTVDEPKGSATDVSFDLTVEYS